MNNENIDWDGFRFFEAVVSSGTLSAAARRLGVSQPTVSRRIDALERDLNAKLFDRLPEGFALTAAGAAMLPFAESMAEAAHSIQRRRTAFEEGLRGSVRIAAGYWVNQFVIENANRLLDGLPGVELEFASAHAFADLSRRDADIALRNRRPERGRFAVRKLPHISFAVYGHKSLCADIGPKDWTELDVHWVGYDENRQSLPSAQWLFKKIGRHPDIRCTDGGAISAAVAAGIGCGVVPSFVGERNPDLLRLSEPFDSAPDGLWLVIHEDLRRVPRVRMIVDRLVELFREKREFLAPQN